jgi:hypothetical protein
MTYKKRFFITNLERLSSYFTYIPEGFSILGIFTLKWMLVWGGGRERNFK